MRITNHFLVAEGAEQITIQKSPNQSAGLSPLYLLMHYTASPSYQGALSWLTNPQAQASAHLLIGRDGKIAQLVGFDKRAWHAGKSVWGQLENMNQFSIGIELVNAGKLRKNSAGQWVDMSMKVIPADEVTLAKHRNDGVEAGWHEYTEEQLEVALNLALLLNSKYHFKDVLGHEDVSPGRKVDPGPLFPLESFRSKIMGRR